MPASTQLSQAASKMQQDKSITSLKKKKLIVIQESCMHSICTERHACLCKLIHANVHVHVYKYEHMHTCI